MSLGTYSGSLRGVTFGVGSSAYDWGPEPPSGLGIPAPTYSDAPLPAGGTSGGIERVDRRIIRVPIYVMADLVTHSSLGNNLGLIADKLVDSLKVAWRPESKDVELDLRLGGPARRYFGRTRGLEVDFTNISQGVATAVGNFEALDWLAYTPATNTVAAVSVVPPATSATLVVPNPGTSPTARCILVINGNGGKPRIVNTTDPNKGFILFREPLLSGQQARINLNTMTIVEETASATNYDSKVSPLSTFFRIQPGNNTITMSGCASTRVVAIRPAYF